MLQLLRSKLLPLLPPTLRVRVSLASTAAYLSRSGWRRGQPWGVEVRLPAGFSGSVGRAHGAASAAATAAADACVSNAPVDGWFWCRLSPLAYCVVRRPNLSAPAIVRSSTLSPPGRRPLLLTIASHCTVALLPSINRFHRSR